VGRSFRPRNLETSAAPNPKRTMSAADTGNTNSASDIVEQNVEAMMAVHAAELSPTRHQRAVERTVNLLARPMCLFATIALIVLWIGLNFVLKASGFDSWDSPGFGRLQAVVSAVALIISLLIIITQSRQGKIAERNAHLDIQVSLLVEQKVTKVIQLLEEIRKDSPTLRNRRDEEAEQLQVALDPSHVASVIAERMNLEPNLDAEAPET
jgi:uncharacterized membrane protein